MIVVADTSPINYLVLLGVEKVLPQLYKRVLMPTAVLSELSDSEAPEIVHRWASKLPDWCEVHAAKESSLPELRPLDAGEREAISIALEVRVELILLDEVKARRVAARVLSVPVRGTLGVLRDAHEAGLIDGAATLHRLKDETNFYVEDELLLRFLRFLR